MTLLANTGLSTAPFLADHEYWARLSPELQITDHPFREAKTRYPIVAPDMRRPIRQAVQEGYLQLPPLIPREETARLAACVTKIFSQGLPPVFAFVYDEFWQMFANLAEVLTPVIGAEPTMNPAEFWVWYVDREKAGWPPHRDFAIGDSLYPDGRPKIASVWVPLTDVTPLNGCMYVLPTHRDPNLRGGLWRKKIDMQHVRALPAQAGSVLCWNSHILHWGSMC